MFAVIGGVVESDGFWSVLYHNPGNANHWIKLRLTGTKANRFGVGARIRVDVVAGDGSKRSIFRDVSSGGSFGAQSLRPEIGIGDAKQVERIEIRWPGRGTVQVIDGPLAADAIYAIPEGSAEVKRSGPVGKVQQAAR